jgi:hypothetical protein
MVEGYVSDMMRKATSMTSSGVAKGKRTNFPQSSEITAPYILTCNYADGSQKIVRIHRFALKTFHHFTDFHGIEWAAASFQL